VIDLDVFNSAQQAPAALLRASDASLPPADGSSDITQFVRSHADFVFRSLRRLGLSVHAAEDAAQQVFMIAANKRAAILLGKEKAFLFATLTNVVRHARRSFARAREDIVADAGELAAPPSRPGGPEQELVSAQARATLDGILAGMTSELREVFVLIEIEEFTMADAAETLTIPPGTVASRLRRARSYFENAVAEYQAKEAAQ
jgi:RNA polymerase sigma-70 factor, ECF subfamily